MTKRPLVRAIYIEVPEKEYKEFKVYAAIHGVTLQRFIRGSARFLISESKKSKEKDLT